jgi:hypothetical protein
MFLSPASDANCYTTSAVTWVNGAMYPPGYYPIFYLGGPGAKNAACR